MIDVLALLTLLQVRGTQPPAAQNPPAPAPATAQATQSATPQLPNVQETADSLVMVFDETADTIDLEWLTKLCQTTTKINFVYEKGVGEALAAAKVKMLGTKTIPKTEFFNFYQNLMFIYRFTCTRVGRDQTAVYLIQSNSPQPGRPQGANDLKSEPLYVDANDVEKYAGQVATQLITVLHLPHTQVRSLQNSLRVLGGEATNSVLSVGDTNSVIITGTGSQVAMYTRLLRLVDDEAAKEGNVAPSFEIIPLEYASGSDVSEMLDQLLEASRRATQAQRAQAAQGATAQLTGQGQESKIIVDKRTNSLIVMAMPDDMNRIKQLVARLDVDVIEPERTYHIYALDNVKAEDLAKVLKDFIQDSARVTPTGPGGRGGAQPGNAAANANSGDNEIVVVPDPATNSLLIAAGKTRYDEMRDLVRQLDRRQDQVLIETALVELSGKNFRDLGVELGFATIPSGNGNGGFGVTSFGLSTLIDSNKDGFIDSRVPNQANGVTAGILDGNNFGMPFLLQAIQTLNDTNILNVPSVLVNNNGSAKVASIDEVPTTTVTASGGIGGQTQQNFKDFQKAGITLQISPSISASGYLRLKIYLEVSSFQGSFQAGDSIPPPRITRTIDTTVNVPSGDTMVIGGIVTDDKNHTRDQTPWLGDLPLVGWLFRHDSDTYSRTTLYFFVTPHILRDKDFADLAEYSYQRKLEAAEKIGAARIQVIDHNFRKPEEGLDLEGFDVPLYRSPARGEVDPSAVGLDPVKRAELLKKDAAANKPPEPTKKDESKPQGEPQGDH